MERSKPMLNLVSQTATSSSIAPSSSASNRPGILRAPSQQGSNLKAKGAGKRAAGGANQNDAASSSQVWLSDAKTNDNARKLAAARANQDLSFKNVQGNLPQKIPKSSSTTTRSGRTTTTHLVLTFHISIKQLNRKPKDIMEDLDVNALIRRMFMTVTQQAAVEFTFNQKSDTTKQRNTYFDVTKKLVKDQKEIQGISVIDWQHSSWKRAILLIDRAVLCILRLSIVHGKNC